MVNEKIDARSTIDEGRRRDLFRRGSAKVVFYIHMYVYVYLYTHILCTIKICVRGALIYESSLGAISFEISFTRTFFEVMSSNFRKCFHNSRANQIYYSLADE